MTAIAGFVDQETGEVIIGGDSSAVNQSMDMLVSKAPKVFMNGDFLIGFAGDFRWGQLFRYAKFPKCRTEDVEQYLTLHFANTLRGAAREMGCLQERHGQEVGTGICLVGYRGRLFLIQETFEAIEVVDGMVSIGLGSSYVLGALKASSLTGEDRVRQALEVSAYYCGGVRAPFHLIRLKAHARAAGSKARANHPRNHRRNRRDKKRSQESRPRGARANETMGRRHDAPVEIVPNRRGGPVRKLTDNGLSHPARQERKTYHAR
jgi:ATP-dependent protease HslVU (ClpYQ) peptidase subunit